MKLSGWLLSAVLLYFLVGTLDYRDELEIENEMLKARVARMIEPPNLSHPLRCNWVRQRIDVRNKRGEITRSKLKTKCG